MKVGEPMWGAVLKPCGDMWKEVKNMVDLEYTKQTTYIVNVIWNNVLDATHRPLRTMNINLILSKYT